jgi:centrosomal CEP192-like protein
MSSPNTVFRPLVVASTIPLILVLATTAVSAPIQGTSSKFRSLAANPLSLSFGSIQPGSTKVQYETLTNFGRRTVIISQATVTGAGFRLSGLALPLSLNSGQRFTFGVLFAPTAAGSVSGAIAVVSNASNPNLSISVSGTGASTGQLTSSASALNFGSVTVGASKSLTTTLTATGSSVTISSATISSPEFRLNGPSLPLTIAAGQGVLFTLTFTPQASGAASGSIFFAGTASNAPILETLTGSGTATASHSVSLYWNSSPSAVVGYNLYRGAKSGGPYTKVNPVLNAATSYTDNSVQGGTIYYYVSTSVNSDGTESVYSNQQQAVIPSP